MAGLLGALLNDYEGERRRYRDKFAGLKSDKVQEPAAGDAWTKTIPVSLFYRVYDKPYAVGDVRFDLVLSEAHSLTSNISEHPVEEGATISDHIQQNLRSGKLRGLVSNYSIQAEGGDGETNRAMNAWLLFQNLWKSRQLVTIVTTLEVYENVAVVNVSTNRDDSTGDSLEFDVDFRQVKMAALQEVTVSATVKPVDMTTNQRKKSATKVKKGRVTGKETKLATTADGTIDLGSISISGSNSTILARPGL
jgi:hypothetical protein